MAAFKFKKYSFCFNVKKANHIKRAAGFAVTA